MKWASTPGASAHKQERQRFNRTFFRDFYENFATLPIDKTPVRRYIPCAHMRIKSGVNAIGVHPSILHAIDIADYTWRDIAQREATVTSLGDGDHSANSLHFGKPGDARCRACDLRINDLRPDLVPRLVENLKLMLGEAFDVILEPDHIHIEYDPY